jgi:hypothetical protein
MSNVVVIAHDAEGISATLRTAIRANGCAAISASFHGSLAARRSNVAITGDIFNLTMHSPPRSLRCVPHRTDENDLTARPPKPMFRLTSWGGAERSPNVLRSLIEIRTPSFSGWGCDCCAWTHPASILTNPQLPGREATTDFNLHLCGDYPDLEIAG